MRVLHVLPTKASHYGGPVRIADAFVKQLLKAGHSARIYPVSDPSSDAEGLGYWPGAKGLRALAAEVRDVDLVHIHGLWTIPTSAASLCARVSKRPFVIQPHGMLDRWSLRRSAAKKKIYAALVERSNLDAASAVHFYHEEEREEAKDFGIRVPSYLLPNGVYLDAFSGLPGKDALRREYPEIGDKVAVLFLGRIHPKKGLPLLVSALAEVLGRGQRVHLIVAGPDEAGHRAEVEAQVAQLGVTNAVTFTGPVEGDKKKLLLGGADVFALTSHQEGDSVAVKEALGAGLPVLITYPCHLRQVAEEGAGFVVNPDVKEIVTALDALTRDGATRDAMGRNARGLVEREFRWEVIGARLVERYQEVLARFQSKMSS
jgi:glycosyltransferase involved in cell wall biosynthesis